jgi:hypothetical protein
MVRRRALPALILTAIFLGSFGCGRGAQSVHGNLEKQIKDRVKLVQDPTIFTLFVLLNVAGYDEENRTAGMHPVRLRIRAEVDTLISPEFRTRLREFYDLHRAQASPWTYCVVAKASSGPPDFAPDSVWTKELAGKGEFNGLDKVHALLREFHRKIPVDRLYGEVRPEYETYIRAYRKAMHKEVAAALAYARVRDVSELPGRGQLAVVIPNLLDSYRRATSFVLGDTLYSVEGPQEKVGYNPHEFIHAVTNPAVYDPALSAKSEKARPVLEALRMANAEGDFRSPAALLDESLVRAVSLRYDMAKATSEQKAALEKDLLQEYRSGYILERYFWEKLADYEASAQSLRQYYPVMLDSLNVLKEIRRWQAEIVVKPGAGAAPESTGLGAQ